MLIREAVGTVLREERKELGMTLRDVADFSTVGLGYLSEVERGIKEPNSSKLETICSALGLEQADLLHRAAVVLHRNELTRVAR